MKKPMKKPKPLNVEFYDRPTLEVARDLIGCSLIRETSTGVFAARIIETEAYIGEGDKACHASKGRTPRTEVMFGRPGVAYVYLIYGMYHCLNLVTERDGFPAAVLIRGLEAVTSFKSFKSLSGPGRLCREFEITREFNGHDVTQKSGLYVLPRAENPDEIGQIIQTPRIGVAYAGADALLPWRFILSSPPSRPSP